MITFVIYTLSFFLAAAILVGGAFGFIFREEIKKAKGKDSMFDFIKKLFGEGKIRVSFTDENGKEWIAKVPYIGDINTIDTNELMVQVSNQWRVEHGTRIINFKVLDWY